MSAKALQLPGVGFLFVVLTAGAASAAPPNLIGAVAADVASKQVGPLERVDGRWHKDQRDCAGLVRFALRQAYRELAPNRLEQPLFVDDQGRPTDFADAQTLITKNFLRLGRQSALAQAQSGDVLAYRHDRGDEVVWHLMLVVAPAAGRQLFVVYHPGEKGAEVRSGRVADLTAQAPLEWRPVDENVAFLGVFRFRELSLLPAVSSSLSAPGGSHG